MQSQMSEMSATVFNVPASSASDCQSADNVDTSLTRHQRADQVSRSQHLLDPVLHLGLRQLGALRDLGVGCPGREPIADGLEELLDCSLLGVERHPANHSLTRLVRVHTRPGNLSGENESARVRLRVRLRERHHHSGEVVHEPVAYPPLGHPHGVPVVVDRVHVRGLPKLVHVNLDELQAPDLTDVLHLEAGADLGKNPRSSVVHGLSQFSSKLFESGIARPSKLRASARAFACSSLRPCAIRLNPGRSGLVGGIFIHTEYVFMSLLWATKKKPRGLHGAASYFRLLHVDVNHGLFLAPLRAEGLVDEVQVFPDQMNHVGHSRSCPSVPGLALGTADPTDDGVTYRLELLLDGVDLDLGHVTSGGLRTDTKSRPSKTYTSTLQGPGQTSPPEFPRPLP